MDNTLFIASFPDLSCFDFSKTNIKVGNIDNSDYFFNSKDHNYIYSYINSLKSLVGSCDILFVPANDGVISGLENEGIKCVVLYPNISCKDNFLQDLAKSGVEEEFVSMIDSSWDFVISRLDKHDYSYKFVMGEDDKVLDVLDKLLTKRDKLAVSRCDIKTDISVELVESLFSYCLLREDEFSEGKPSVQSVFCEGIKYDYYFNLKRLSEKKESIENLINCVKSIEDGISAYKLGINKDGKAWTNSVDVMEKVMVLGVSSGDLVLPFSRNFDLSLKGQVPYVIKSSILKKI